MEGRGKRQGVKEGERRRERKRKKKENGERDARTAQEGARIPPTQSFSLGVRAEGAREKLFEGKPKAENAFPTLLPALQRRRHRSPRKIGQGAGPSPARRGQHKHKIAVKSQY
eukprot:965229-Pleurochrysis_carterae.AAC.1